MAVKDKLEIERLYSILEDLETMYTNEEISEETYYEMKKRYQDKISALQDKIMDLEKSPEEIASEKLEEVVECTGENVNELLKNTMRALKKQLKTIGVEPCCESFIEEETIKLPIKKGERASLKVYLEKGKVEIKSGDYKEVNIFAQKNVRGVNEKEASKSLKDVDINVKSIEKDGHHIIKINPDLPKRASLNLLIKIPDSASNSFFIDSERGSISLKNLSSEECELDVENGNIELKNNKTKNLTIHSENGSISLDNVEIKNDAEIVNNNGNIKLIDSSGLGLKASTEKGNISAYCSFEKGKLSTELGSIQFRPIDNRKQYYRISSELGSISITSDEDLVPWLIRAQVEMGSVKNRSNLKSKKENGENIFMSSDFDAKKDNITVEASTELGSIKIKGKDRI